ncbi:flagellin [Pectobacterium actinidiae]|uniref:flagellin n=1 Tax=Pectobacterium actinidiae TaxID=1507808 RepID=UPI0037FF1786
MAIAVNMVAKSIALSLSARVCLTFLLLQATSYKLQATSYKLQATSYKLQATSNARSRILDADYAQEVSLMTKQQILQQASSSMLVLANQGPQAMLMLLQR